MRALYFYSPVSVGGGAELVVLAIDSGDSGLPVSCAFSRARFRASMEAGVIVVRYCIRGVMVGGVGS